MYARKRFCRTRQLTYSIWKVQSLNTTHNNVNFAMRLVEVLRRP